MEQAPLEAESADKVRCDACPVTCYIRLGMAGACDRYANRDGKLVRVDPHILLKRTVERGGGVVPFSLSRKETEWSGDILPDESIFVTAIGAGTTYPDYKPAPFIVSSEVDGVDMVTVVTEGIFSYCGVKAKIDTDRYLGPEQATVRAEGEAIGHVTTGEYGSQMLSLGGVHHLTGGSKKEGRVTCDALLNLSNGKAVELTIDGGETIVVQAGAAPVINGLREERMRVGCGSATIGMFAKQWLGHVDEVVVVDDHITGVLSEHQAGKVLDIPPTGVKMKGRRSTPGRYFQVAEPGTGWGGRTSPIRFRSLAPSIRNTPSRGSPCSWSRPPASITVSIGSTKACARLKASCRRPCAFPSTASRKIANRLCAPCFSWAARAARCAQA